jgi:hypothetical protein
VHLSKKQSDKGKQNSGRYGLEINVRHIPHQILFIIHLAGRAMLGLIKNASQPHIIAPLGARILMNTDNGLFVPY